MSHVLRDEAMLIGERTRLVRLCYRLTGSLDAAEDLAQETLYEAVRNAHKLRDPSGHSKWLSSIESRHYVLCRTATLVANSLCGCELSHQDGKRRTAGLGPLDVREPLAHTQDVAGCGGEHMPEMGPGQTDVAGTPQSWSPYSLRDRTLDTGSDCIFLLRPQAQPPRSPGPADFATS